MSLNKWKKWPVEILEDVLKIDKKTYDHEKRILWPVFDQNKISDPDNAGDGRIQKKFLINFDIWNVEIRVRMWKLDQFWERTPN